MRCDAHVILLSSLELDKNAGLRVCWEYTTARNNAVDVCIVM